ncbi:MAG TPA: hypothetical protein PK339_01730 [Flavitalea sp.]|nr:hypothetical protein [Flavitalea sp.]
MHYLLTLYDNDIPGIVEALKKIKYQLEELPLQFDALLKDADASGIGVLCHKAGNSAALIGARSLSAALMSLEKGLSEKKYCADDLAGEVSGIRELIQSAADSVNLQLRIYGQ